MKKSLVALAALAATTGAFAQSTVTLFGVLDAAYTYGRSDTNSMTSMTTSSNLSSRLGFRGEEDLGGGMKAGFHLEAGVANDSGAGSATNTNNQTVTALTSAGTQGLTFNRRSTVSLMGSAGELRVGRDYTPHFWNQTVYDPFGTNGVGANVAHTGGSGLSTNLTGVRALMKALRNGGSIGLLPDQVPGAGEGVWTHFFNRLAYTMTLPAKLAQMSGAVLVLAYAERLPKGAGYAVHFVPFDGQLTGTPEQQAGAINAAMEALIARCPAQYFWSYNRYKGRPPAQGVTA